MDKNAVATGAVTIAVGTIMMVVLEILTENPSLTDIAVFAVGFAVTAAITYFIISMILAKAAKKSN